MPRNKGSKNLPKSDEVLMKELETRGYKVIKNNADTTPEKTDSDDIEPARPVAKTKENLEIKKPKKVHQATVEETNSVKEDESIYRCGNKLCGKILDKPYSKCPHCEVSLTWQ